MAMGLWQRALGRRARPQAKQDHRLDLCVRVGGQFGRSGVMERRAAYGERGECGGGMCHNTEKQLLVHGE